MQERGLEGEGRWKGQEEDLESYSTHLETRPATPRAHPHPHPKAPVVSPDCAFRVSPQHWCSHAASFSQSSVKTHMLSGGTTDLVIANNLHCEEAPTFFLKHHG